MKKMFTILAVVFAAAFISSCSEEEINPQTESNEGALGEHDREDF